MDKIKKENLKHQLPKLFLLKFKVFENGIGFYGFVFISANVGLA